MAPLILQWYDYSILIFVLVSSILIGIYFGCCAQQPRDKINYLWGGRRMKPFPLSISLTAMNFFCPILLSIPAEVYRYGAYYFLITLSVAIMCGLSVWLYLPVFYSLKLNTTFEYLERRFDEKCRKFASAMFLLSSCFLLSICIYSPALALSAVTPMDTRNLVIIVSSVCIVYTALGGVVTVVWTDVLQFGITLSLLLFILGLAIVELDLYDIFGKAWQSGRLNIFDLYPDPTKKDTFWAFLFGMSVHLMTFTADQCFMQKLLSVSSYRQASISLILFGIGFVVISGVLVGLGLVMYARYSNCDPVTANILQHNDQILPYFVMDIGQDIPGVLPLFIAGMCSSSLSLQSTMLNSIAGSFYEDFIKDWVRSERENRKLKLLVVGLGIICTVFGVMMEYLGEIFPFIVSLFGLFGGISLGLFTLGLFFPKANANGAFYGSVLGFCCIACLALPAKYYEMKGFISYVSKPLSVKGCLAYNETLTIDTDHYQVPVICRISSLYYALLAVSLTIIFGVIISRFTTRVDDRVEASLISRPFRALVADDCLKYQAVALDKTFE